MYNEQTIRNELSQYNNEVRFILKEEVGSTNDELQLLAKSGMDEVTVMLSESQTLGKGRMGRTFHSPKGSGIYMSILLRPDFLPDDCNLLTPMTAVAAAKAISEVLSVKADIKWVNDIYVKGRKAAGILTKAAFSSKDKTDYVIVGIGINLTVPEEGFHEEIKDIATALKEEVSPDERDRLVGVFLRELLSYYKCMPEVTFSEEYRKRLLYVGEKITVREKESFYSATVIGVNERLQLEVLTEDGKKKTLYTEEITIRQDDING